MKNILYSFSLIAVIALFTPHVHAAEKQAAVIVTIKPLHSLVASVMGDTGEPVLLVTGLQSPHGFQLKPSQMQQLEHADIVFYIDDAFESYLVRAFESMPKDVTRVSAAKASDMTILEARKGGAWEKHEHHEHKEHEHHDEHDHEVHHDEHEDHHDDHATTQDPHLWLDPKNAKQIVAQIVSELSQRYPQHADIYAANGARTVQELSALDHELKNRMQPLSDRPYIVFHDAFQYFERAYGLQSVGSVTIDPEVAPSAKRVKDIRDRVQQTKAVCLFREPQFPDGVLNTIAEGTDARIGMLDEVGYQLNPGKDLYAELLRSLASGFENCLMKNEKKR